MGPKSKIFAWILLLLWGQNRQSCHAKPLLLPFPPHQITFLTSPATQNTFLATPATPKRFLPARSRSMTRQSSDERVTKFYLDIISMAMICPN